MIHAIRDVPQHDLCVGMLVHAGRLTELVLGEMRKHTVVRTSNPCWTLSRSTAFRLFTGRDEDVELAWPGVPNIGSLICRTGVVWRGYETLSTGTVMRRSMLSCDQYRLRNSLSR